MIPFSRKVATVSALCAMILSLSPASAQTRQVPTSPMELKLSYAPIVQRVQPAVVNVYAAKTVQNRNPLLDDPVFRRFFGVPGNQRPNGGAVALLHGVDEANAVARRPEAGDRRQRNQ